MKVRSTPVFNPRTKIVKRLLDVAEFCRTKARDTDEADEALRWEKDLRKRAEEIEAEPVAKAA